MKKHLISLLFCTTLGIIFGPANAQNFPTTQIPCPTPVAPEEVDGKTTICGVLTVPENYNNPNGRQVEISYAILKSKSLSPQPDPVVVLHGGPGGSDIALLAAYTPFYAPQRQTRDVILFDQRGSRFSGDQMCAPILTTLDALTKVPHGEWEQKFENYTRNLARTLKGDLGDSPEIFAMLKICSEILQLHGFDLTQYNTSSNARDVVSLAKSLGYEKVNLYGISYGTYLALRLMRDHPQRLRSVILDSTIPPNVKKYESLMEDFEVSLLNLLEDCYQDAACNRAYPDLKSRTIALIAALEKKPIPIEKDKSVGVQELVALLEGINQDLDGQKAAYVPLIISELEQGITTTYVGVMSGTIFPKPPTKPFPIGGSAELLAKSEDLRAQARKLLTEAAQVAEGQRPSQQWVKQALAAIETLPEVERPLARANLYGIGFEPQKPRNKETLIFGVAEIFPEAMHNSLQLPLQSMGEVEIRHTYEVISNVLRQVSPNDAAVSQGVFRTIDCQDLIPPSDLNRAEAILRGMEMPALGQNRLIAAQQAFALCQFWPVKPAPKADQEAVKSTIPTLVLQGRYDIQTNSRVGRQALVGLTKGHLLEFPNAGHGVLIFSQCARDVGVSFINDPSQTPNADCRTNLKPQFVLPNKS